MLCPVAYSLNVCNAFACEHLKPSCTYAPRCPILSQSSTTAEPARSSSESLNLAYLEPGTNAGHFMFTIQ
ncbi:hypothetical protein N7466_011062 [Penicillium verhagenii]|uniref:uncharacterized protein n=1 Tax=Penicillium verhagenii TaxID=1562060 RepID=UPI0025458E7B|nr:uncharacterized protein N7466_011062 [Penicillium verhagenii]KAJ5917508.1 hypothetical protein N7466_011062 [Penicillium verhagenii]